MQESSHEERERQRLLAQYSEIATLAGGLAHEIRNPLSTIGMNLELLIEDLEDPQSPRERRMFTKIRLLQQECRNLEEILNAFLQFARAGELELEPADLNEQVGRFIEFYQPLAREHQIELSPHLDPDLPRVMLDASLMRQVWMNLTQNAQQAMPQGGLIEFQTYSRDDMVHLDLIDNGDGMDERVKSNMFQAFFSTKRNGSGLGLAISHGIVQGLGGELRLHDRDGDKSTFVTALPLTSS